MIISFLKTRALLVVGLLILLISVSAYFFWPKTSKGAASGQTIEKVTSPAIVNGELVLPKVYSGGVLDSKSKIYVMSAFLVGVFEEPKTGQTNPFGAAQPAEPPKLVGIRILGEISNASKKIVKEVSPVVRFYNDKDKLIAQKIGRLTPGFDFFSFKPGSKTVYDILVEDPPKSDKLEILINSAKEEKTPSFESLKIQNGKIEVKTAKYQQQAAGSEQLAVSDSTESGEATGSAEATPSATPKPTPTEAPTEVEYYTISGSVVNNLVDSVSDVAIYAWVKNSEGKVFSFGRYDFKSDLLSPKKQVNFKINLLPFKTSEKMQSYEIAAFGKRYKL